MPNSCHSGKRASGETGVSKHRRPAHFSDCACQAWLWLAVNAIVVSSEKPLVGFWINKPVCVHRLDRSGYVTILLFKSTLLFLFTCENIFSWIMFPWFSVLDHDAVLEARNRTFLPVVYRESLSSWMPG